MSYENHRYRDILGAIYHSSVIRAERDNVGFVTGLGRTISDLYNHGLESLCQPCYDRSGFVPPSVYSRGESRGRSGKPTRGYEAKGDERPKTKEIKKGRQR